MNLFLVYDFDSDQVIQIIDFISESKESNWYKVTLRDLLRSRGFDPDCFVFRMNNE